MKKTNNKEMAKQNKFVMLLAAIALLCVGQATAQTVGGAVYGGGRKANVQGAATVTVKGSDQGQNGAPAINAVYGGNDIAGRVGGALLVDLQGGVIGDVFGGGNGNYGCSENGVYTDAFNRSTDPTDAHNVIGLQVPVVTNSAGTKVLVHGATYNETAHTGLKVTGSIYAGGNLASVGQSGTDNGSFAKVYLRSGTITNAYGGGRMAPIFGTQGIEFTDENTTISGYTLPSGAIAMSEASTVHVEGDVYGSNDIANLTDEAESFTSSIKVGGNPQISGNVFGGGNGDYDYTTHPGEVWTNTTPSTYVATLCTGYGAPVVNTGADTVAMGNTGTITGTVYGGGNAADVLTSTTVTLTSGSVANIYGGCNKSDVGTTSTVTMNGGTVTTALYGGNDKSGTVTGLASVSITDGTVNGNVYGGSNGAYAEVNNAYPYGTLPANENTKVSVSGGTFANTSNVFGGGNAAPVSGTAAVQVSAGTLNGNVFGGGNLATVGTTDVDITGGTINTLYGGGNQANVTTADVAINGGTITTAYAGGNAATVSGTANITMAQAENATLTVGTLFGGNNQADMSIIPDITLTSGTVTDVYGGGNAGNMVCDNVLLSTKVATDNDIMGQFKIPVNTKISTYININGTVTNGEQKMTINGNVYGGCRQANVTNATYVHLTNGNVNAIFGGNDIAGQCENTYVHIDGGQVTEVYGGSNGYGSRGTVYDYTNVARPSNTQTHVYIHKGTIPTTGAIYGGGLAAESQYTNLLVDGTAVINGSLFGAGCGVQSDACQAHLGNVTTLAKTDIKSMSASSRVSTVYGGGNAGDVALTQLTIFNTCGGQFETVYGGCRAANISGTAQTLIGQSSGTTSALRIGTVYGGNDYAGWVNKVDLQLLDGTLGTVFGGANGDYNDYADKCDRVPFNNDIHITVSDPACKGSSNLHITGNLYGGGNMGVVGFDYDKDGDIDLGTTRVFDDDEELPTYAQYGNCFDGRATSVGEYGQIVVDVYGGTIEGHIFGGASGAKFEGEDTKSDIYGNDKKTLVYGLKQVNLYNGLVLHSVYGGSESANDGYPFEIIVPGYDAETNPNAEAVTSLRPSSILNLMGGTVTKNVYGAGFYGNVYGSVYVNVGVHAVDGCVAYQPYSSSASHTRSYNSGINAYYVGMKPVYSSVYNKYSPGDLRNLDLLSSIYNGADWGEAGANAIFDTRNFFGGESRVLVDGEEYNAPDKPSMDIAYSIFGSGTSCEGGDIWRNITVRNYGEQGCEPTKALYSIQRADTVLFQNVGLLLHGEQDAYSSYPSADYAINKVDKRVVFLEKNTIATEAPILEIAALESRNADYTLMSNASVSARPDASCDDMCGRLVPTVLAKNVLILLNGTYVSVSQDGVYKPVNGFMYVVSENRTQASVFAATQDQQSQAPSGGFMDPCVGGNTSDFNDMTQLGYTNIDAVQPYRTWTLGSDCGSRERKTAIVANSGILTVNDNKLIYDANNDNPYIIKDASGNTIQNADGTGDSVISLAVAHATLELPAADAGSYYTLASVSVSGTASGAQVELVNAGWVGDFSKENNVITLSNGQLITTGNFATDADRQQTIDDNIRKMAENPNYNFGLSFAAKNNFDTAGTGQTSQSLLIGSTNWGTVTNFNRTPGVVSGARSVIPTMELFLTYNPALDASLLRDVTFTLIEHKAIAWDEDGEATAWQACDAKVDVTVALATIVSDFEAFEVDVLAMYNGGLTNEYVGKVILPATFQRRQIRLASVKWKCEKDETGLECCYGDDHLFHLVDAKDAYDETRSAEVTVAKNITNFALKMGATQSTGDATSSILGWYDIPANMKDVDLYSLLPNAPELNGYADRLAISKTNIVNQVDTFSANQVVIGTLDGRATAGIDFSLCFDGLLKYYDHYRNDKVGTVTMTFSYLTKNIVDGRVVGSDTTKTFNVVVNVRTRQQADTFYVGTVDQWAGYDACDRSTDAITAAGDEAGKRPKYYFKNWDNIKELGHIQTGDVIAIVAPVEFSDTRTIGPDDVNQRQIIRYSGSHQDASGDTKANRDAMFVIQDSAVVDMRNVRVNGSALTRTRQSLPWGENGRNIDTLYRDTIFAHSPMFVVEGNAQLNLTTNATLLNNINEGCVTGSDRKHGGAIGIYGDEAVVRLGDGVEIRDNIVFSDRDSNSGAGVYVYAGQLRLGSQFSEFEPVVKIWNNFTMPDKNHLTVKEVETSSDPIGTIDKQVGAGCPRIDASCNPVPTIASNIYTFSEFVLDIDNINEHKHQSNVFLNRESRNIAGYASRLDSKSCRMYLDKVLGKESKIGVTKWLEDETLLASDWVRDTILIVESAAERYANVAMSNGTFVVDNSHNLDETKHIFYNQVLNSNLIYLHHCATFGQRLRAGFKSFEIQNGTPEDFDMVAGTTNANNAEGAVNYHYIPTAACAVPLENVHFMVQGGFYPYSYNWSYADYAATDPADSVYRNIRNFTTEYGPSISSKDDTGSTNNYDRRMLSSSDTIALNEVALGPNVNDKAVIYKVTANDLTGFCPATAKIYVKMIRTSESGRWETINYTANTEIDSATNFDTATYKYLRHVKGTDVSFEVAPSWNYGDIVINAQVDQIGDIPAGGIVLNSSTTNGDNIDVTSSPIYTVKKIFCPGDELLLTTNKQLQNAEFVMWDFDASAPQNSALFVVPDYTAHIKAIYAPNDYWKDYVKTVNGTYKVNGVDQSVTDGFQVDYDGNVNIYNEAGLAWLISTTNGLNHSVATQYHNLTVTIHPKANGLPYDMSEHRWTPLGNINNHFAGTFDGNKDSVVIKGINCFEEDIPFVGFFGNTEGATIQNVYLNGTVITGSNYVGGIVASATDSTTITGCKVENVSAFSSDYVVGGIAGQVSGTGNTIDNTNYVNIALLGTVVSAGGCVGVLNGTGNTIENVTGDVNTSKLSSCVYLGGLVAETNNGTTGAKGGRKGAKDASAQNHIANNYVHLITNGNGRRVGGLVGNASDVSLENNYAYGQILGSQRVGGIIAQVGSNVNVDRCFYEEGCANEAIASGAKSTTNVSTFSGTGNQVLSATSVDGINNVTRILNRWVREQGEGYNTWRSDLKFENHGYPLFGEPDLIPVSDTTVENVCDQFVFDGVEYTTSAVFSLNVIDSVEMIDSTMYFVYNVGYSDYQAYSAEAQAEDGYEGYGFSLTADELEQMMDGATDVRTFILVDSLLTEHGCDSVITLTLTVYPKLGVDPVDAEPFEVSVYPNPTRGQVTVEAREMTLIEVYDNASRRVLTLNLKGDKEQLNLSHLATGTYYIRVTTENGTAVKKLIKK